MRFLPWRSIRPEVVEQQREVEDVLAQAQASGERVEELAVAMNRISARNSFTESFRRALSPPPLRKGRPT
jgi:hypothetical protein